MTLHLKEKENGKIIGRISGSGQNKEEITFGKKIEEASNVQNVKNMHENFPSKPTENIQRPGKRAIFEFGGDDEPQIGNRPQIRQKLMHSAMSATQKEWQRRFQQQHFGQDVQKYEKGVEIGGDSDNPSKKWEKLMPLNYSPFLLHRQEHSQHENLGTATAGGNEIILNFGEEYGGKPQTPANIPPTAGAHFNNEQIWDFGGGDTLQKSGEN